MDWERIHSLALRELCDIAAWYLVAGLTGDAENQLFDAYLAAKYRARFKTGRNLPRRASIPEA